MYNIIVQLNKESCPSWPKEHDWKSCIPQKGIRGSNPRLSATFQPPCGEVAERLNAAVSKTVLPVNPVTRVRIPASPPCGCRQVVRHELPKLTRAGSSPVTRSITNYAAGWSGLQFSFPRQTRVTGREPMRSEAVKQTRQWRVCRPTV